MLGFDLIFYIVPNIKFNIRLGRMMSENYGIKYRFKLVYIQPFYLIHMRPSIRPYHACGLEKEPDIRSIPTEQRSTVLIFCIRSGQISGRNNRHPSVTRADIYIRPNRYPKAKLCRFFFNVYFCH